MTDVVTLLTTDHRTLDSLFDQVAGNHAPDQDIVDRIVKELSIHDAVEREYLYPALRGVEGGDRYADTSVAEHDEVARTLLAIDKAPSGSAELAPLLATLITAVRQHVAEEEGQIFPALRTGMSAEQLDELGSTIDRAKAAAPTRPHPHAPSEGVGTKLAGLASAPLDRARDAVQGRS